LGCSISGAGPSIFALFKGETAAQKGGIAMRNIFELHGIPATLYTGKINQGGAVVLS
jgi:homoserine kinase